jgi:hypothetical protein
MVAAGQWPGTQFDDSRYGGSKIVHHDVEMELLRSLGVRPVRRLMVGGELERHAGGMVVPSDDNPVCGLIRNRQAEHLGVEGS